MHRRRDDRPPPGSGRRPLRPPASSPARHGHGHAATHHTAASLAQSCPMLLAWPSVGGVPGRWGGAEPANDCEEGGGRGNGGGGGGGKRRRRRRRVSVWEARASLGLSHIILLGIPPCMGAGRRGGGDAPTPSAPCRLPPPLLLRRRRAVDWREREAKKPARAGAALPRLALFAASPRCARRRRKQTNTKGVSSENAARARTPVPRRMTSAIMSASR